MYANCFTQTILSIYKQRMPSEWVRVSWKKKNNNVVLLINMNSYICTTLCQEKKKRQLPDFGIAGHFILRVMNIHCILDDGAIFIDFNLLCNSSNCKVVTIPVKFNTKGEGEHTRHLWVCVQPCDIIADFQDFTFFFLFLQCWGLKLGHMWILDKHETPELCPQLTFSLFKEFLSISTDKTASSNIFKSH